MIAIIALIFHLSLCHAFSFHSIHHEPRWNHLKLYSAIIPSQSKRERGGFSNYYDILGVPSNASVKQIKEMYRKRVKECHPDSCLSNTPLDDYYELENAYRLLIYLINFVYFTVHNLCFILVV